MSEKVTSLEAELEELKTKLQGMTTHTHKTMFNFMKDKENRAASTTSLDRLKHLPSTTNVMCTPTAKHTKSSLLRLKNVLNSPAKREKCLDHSCFVNNDKHKEETNNKKRKSHCLEDDTRSTKKRKAATAAPARKSKSRVSNVIRRVYETRSRTNNKLRSGTKK